MAQPLAFNSSRMASERLKSLAFAGGLAGFEQRLQFRQELSRSPACADSPRTESILSHAASAECGRRRRNVAFSSISLFVSRTHSKMAPQAAETLKSSSRASANLRKQPGSG